MQNQDTQLVVPAEEAGVIATLQRKAELLAMSQFVPSHYQGKPADCMVALQWAERTGRDPLELLQNTFPINGNSGMFTRYMVALERRAGIFDAPIRWEFAGEGKDLVVTAYGLIDGERYEAEASMALAIAEDWTKNKKYKSREGQRHMLKWRSAAFLIRFTAPDVLLGMSTIEELQDLNAIPPQAQLTGAAAKLNEVLAGNAKPETEPEPVDEPEEAQFQEVQGEPLKTVGEDLKEQWAQASETAETFDNENLFDTAPEKPGDSA